MQSESFPMVMPQCRKLVQILQFRDWVRECFLIILQLDSVGAVPKLSKIKLRKHLKRLIIKGELLIGLSQEFLDVANEQKEVSKDLFLDVLRNLLTRARRSKATSFSLRICSPTSAASMSRKAARWSCSSSPRC